MKVPGRKSFISFFFTWFYVCLDVDLGEKKDFYIVNFFFTKIADSGEKKDLYIVIFFFTKNHVFWWKKSLLYKNLFFHQVLRFWSITWKCVKKKFSINYLFFHHVLRCQKFFWNLIRKVGEKKVFCIKSFFSPSFMLPRFFQVLQSEKLLKKKITVEKLFFHQVLCQMPKMFHILLAVLLGTLTSTGLSTCW